MDDDVWQGVTHRNHTNPPIASEPQWDSPQTRALAMQSCFDCHSNQTR
jgi:hypothetical protein